MSTEIPREGEHYRHWKGMHYKILYIGRHTETEELMVIYKSLESPLIWVRPVSSFCDLVEGPDGVIRARFSSIFPRTLI